MAAREHPVFLSSCFRRRALKQANSSNPYRKKKLNTNRQGKKTKGKIKRKVSTRLISLSTRCRRNLKTEVSFRKRSNQKVFSVHTTPEEFTAPFNNMRTLKFKAQPTNAFFATVNQMFAGSSQLSTAAERAVIKSLCMQSSNNEQSSAVVVSWEDPPNT